MFQSTDITRMAQALARHAGARQQIIAQNIAQADTPGYRGQDLRDFGETYAGRGTALRTTRAGHQTTTGDVAVQLVSTPADAPNGNGVSLEREMVKAVAARQQHDMALAIYRSTANILRGSLGRGSR